MDTLISSNSLVPTSLPNCMMKPLRNHHCTKSLH